jgi:hypothetical protein
MALYSGYFFPRRIFYALGINDTFLSTLFLANRANPFFLRPLLKRLDRCFCAHPISDNNHSLCAI